MGIYGALMLLVMGITSAEEIKVVQLRNSEEIKAEYCRTETGSGGKFNCGMPYGARQLDIIYVSEEIGKRVEAHVWDAYARGYFYDLNKRDFFHGHLMAKGPRVQYETPAEYLADLQVSLYHSKEYLFDSWERIPLEESPFTPRADQRSFVGFFTGDADGVVPAIDLIKRDLHPEPYPVGFLRGYKGGGTIYTRELNDSQHYSEHQYESHGRHEELWVKTCTAADNNNCRPCSIFSMAYILEQEDGRFLGPNGKKFDVTIHCRY